MLHTLECIVANHFQVCGMQSGCHFNSVENASIVCAKESSVHPFPLNIGANWQNGNQAAHKAYLRNVEDRASWSDSGEQSLVYYFTLESSKVIR